jgi:cytidylate kinase
MVITISNQYGAHAIAIGRLAAAELNYELIDRELPVVVAKRMRVATEEVEAIEDSGRSLGARLLSSMELSTPEVGGGNVGDSFDAETVRAVQEAVREYAARGNVVLVGRGAGMILGRRPDVLRVFMHAPRDWRAQRIMHELGLNEKAAHAEVDRIDRARASHLHDWYEAKFGDPRHYDLSIDTASAGEAGSVALIVAAVRSRA